MRTMNSEADHMNWTAIHCLQFSPESATVPVDMVEASSVSLRKLGTTQKDAPALSTMKSCSQTAIPSPPKTSSAPESGPGVHFTRCNSL